MISRWESVVKLTPYHWHLNRFNTYHLELRKEGCHSFQFAGNIVEHKTDAFDACPTATTPFQFHKHEQTQVQQAQKKLPVHKIWFSQKPKGPSQLVCIFPA